MFQHHSRKSEFIDLRGQSDAVLAPSKFARKVRNFYLTEEGTLRSVPGPAIYQPSRYESGDTPLAYPDPVDGVFHHRLQNGRDILLVQVGGKILEHQGWATTLAGKWNELIGDTGTADYRFKLETERSRCFLTQFVGTPNGVVIIPQGGGDYARALFYDGFIVAPLGFDSAPPSPEGWGPQNEYVANAATTIDTWQDNANILGYAVSAQHDTDTGKSKGIPPAYGTFRLGTISQQPLTPGTGNTNPLGAQLLKGEWRVRAQLRDIWGNRSPLSPPSSPVQLQPQENVSEDRELPGFDRAGERLKHQVVWRLHPSNREEAVAGLDLYRSKDLVNSGDPRFYKLFDYATAGHLVHTTLPGAVAGLFPDNIPDAWLIDAAEEIEPVPMFKLAVLSMGRLWVANCKGDPGRVQASLPGLFGTFPANQRYYPDASGTETTALHAVPGGLLSFTEFSTFLIEPNDAGNGYRIVPVSAAVGCVSPDTVKTMPDGTVVWLSREGFMAWRPGGDGAPVPVSSAIRRKVRSINPTWRIRSCAAVDTRMGEYRCWVPVNGSSSNSLGFIWDGELWRERDDVAVQAVCVSNDEREYMLAVGTATQNRTTWSVPAVAEVQDLYVLDHDHGGAVRSSSETREAVIETSWLRAPASAVRVTPTRIRLWLRETSSAQFKVEVMRDWREHVVQNFEVGESEAPYLFAKDDEPPFLGTAVLGGTVQERNLRDLFNQLPKGTDSVRWLGRRPWWQNIDIAVHDCEVFKLRFTFTGDAEFIGLQFLEESANADLGSANGPGGQR
jgi:hypothetical protein